MVIYIKEANNKLVYFGYALYKAGNAKIASFKDDVVTNIGYMTKSDLKEADDNIVYRVIPETYFSGYVKDHNALITSIIGLGFEIESVIVIGVGPFSFFMKAGDSFDGLKESDFNNIEFVRQMKSKLKDTQESKASLTLAEEILNLSDDNDKHWVFNDKSYLNPSITKPRMLTGNKLIVFPNMLMHDNKHLYMATNVKETDEIGKHISSINYTILMMDEIEEVTSVLKILDLTLQQPIVLKSDLLFKPDTHRILRYGGFKTRRLCGVIEVLLPTDDVIGLLYSPPGLMMLLRDDIRSTLMVYDKNQNIDITSKIYNGKKILSNLENKFVINVVLEETPIILHTAIDTFDRNLFKRLERLEPVVKVFYLSANKVIKYYTSINIGDEVAISYAPFNNIVFKK